MVITVSYGVGPQRRLQSFEMPHKAFEFVQRLRAEKQPNIEIIAQDRSPMTPDQLEAIAKPTSDYLNASRP